MTFGKRANDPIIEEARTARAEFIRKFHILSVSDQQVSVALFNLRITSNLWFPVCNVINWTIGLEGSKIVWMSGSGIAARSIKKNLLFACHESSNLFIQYWVCPTLAIRIIILLLITRMGVGSIWKFGNDYSPTKNSGMPKNCGKTTDSLIYFIDLRRLQMSTGGWQTVY